MYGLRDIRGYVLAAAITCLFVLPASGAERSHWTLQSEGVVEATDALLERVRGITPSNRPASDETITVKWNRALLKAEGADAIEVNMTVVLTVGTSFKVGTSTPYPGIVTKLKSANGEIGVVATGRTVDFRMSERGTWIGKLLHSDARGADHLAAEIPFSLTDKESGQLLTENNLLFGFRLSAESEPVAGPTLIGPTPFFDLRLVSTDMRDALVAKMPPDRRIDYAPDYSLRGAVRSTKFWTRSELNSIGELFDRDSAGLYGCDTDDFMKLELDLSGLTQHGSQISPEIAMQIEFSPAMVGDNETYFETLAGTLTIGHENGVRTVSIGPGNHGNVASKMEMRDDEVIFDLGVALRDGLNKPAVARLEIHCGATAGIQCHSISLSPAADYDRRSLSPRSVSDIFSSQYASTLMRDDSVPPETSRFGGGSTCDFTCPNCLPEGCDEGSYCDTAGAPINCTAGCDHRASAAGCCRGGGSRLCCQVCGSPR